MSPMKKILSAAIVTAVLSGCAASVVPGSYVLRTSEGRTVNVEIRALNKDEFYLASDNQPITGVYKQREELLEMTKPDLPRNAGYVWRVNGSKSLTLVNEPEFSITGLRLISSTLTSE